jgi:hypothetical protein
MSVSISSACWALTLPATEKLVLLCLADFADDAGVCWPSVETIVERTGLSDRCVREQLKRLELSGFICRDRRVGQSAMYQMTIRKAAEDEEGDRHQLPVQPAPDAASTGTICRSNRHDVPVQPAPDAGANRTTNDPPLIHQRTNSAVALPEWVEPSAWQAFRESRRAHRAPFTARAAELILAKLDQLRAEGQNPNQCLLQSVERGWRGVFPVRSNHEVDHRTSRRLSAVERVRLACAEWEDGLDLLDPNDRALRPSVDERAGRNPESNVVEGNFRVVG